MINKMVDQNLNKMKERRIKTKQQKKALQDLMKQMKVADTGAGKKRKCSQGRLMLSLSLDTSQD